MKQIGLLAVALVVSGAAQAATVSAFPVVAELFTSQACSSCPAADSLMKQMAGAHPDLLVLSYHVNYWDHLGWKDPFSLQASTERQRGYYNSLGESTLYTPELVMNGTTSMIGSDEKRFNASFVGDRIADPAFAIQIAADGKKHGLAATVTLHATDAVPEHVEVWEAIYTPYARTRIGSGENEGRTVESIDIVKSVHKLGVLSRGQGHFPLQNSASRKDRIAVIVQVENQGPIVGAATYQP